MIETQPLTASHVFRATHNTLPSTSHAFVFSQRGLLVILLAHVLLGWVLFRFGATAATIHAFLILLLGLFFLFRDAQPARMIYIVAYVVGAEALWRATSARIFWETGKYALILLFGLALLKYARRRKPAIWGLFYFFLLLPSVLMLPTFDRQALAFNLAGPFALALAVMLFSLLKLDMPHFKSVLLAILAPTVTLGFYVLLKIRTAPTIFFGASSNFAASGDYGPNQVAIILALGTLAAIYYALLEENLFIRYLLLAVSLWLLAQSVLTFSRSGFWTTLIALVLSSFYLLRSFRRLSAFLFSALLLAALGYYFVFPYLENFTGSALSSRFSNVNSTGRVEIMRADWLIFSEYPLLGVGPGQSYGYHASTFRAASAHTEYTRLLSEHGIFGLFALLLLLLACARRAFTPMDTVSKAFLVGILAWALLFMVTSATRQVAPSFLLGLVMARINLETPPSMESIAPVPSHNGG